MPSERFGFYSKDDDAEPLKNFELGSELTRFLLETSLDSQVKS